MVWIWSVLGWGLLALGVGVLVWALWWDRAGWRGRATLRCRGCWYDLTGMVGAKEGGPTANRSRQGVTCPECGKGHVSRRAMRRTRRRWWGVAGAGMLLMLAYGVRVAPAVQKDGWGAAVPGLVLVAWMPLMSEEPGTGLSGMGFFGPGSGLPPASGIDRLVMTEIGEGWHWGGDVPAQRLGWVSRRLLFLLARAEDTAVITDGTTAKGRAYKSAVSMVLNGGKAWVSERRWAHGVAHVEALPDRAYGPGEVVRGDFRIRRLVVGGYRLSGSVGSHLVEYRGGSPSAMFINGFAPLGTPQQMADHWIGRFRWDGVHESERALGSGQTEIKHPFGVAEPDGAGGAAVKLYYAVMVNEAGRGEPERIARVATVERSIPVRIDQARAMVVDQSASLRKMLESGLRAELTVDYDRRREAWVPLVRLRWSGSRPDGDEVLIGGMVSVDLVLDGAPVDQGQQLLGSRNDQSWWLLGPSAPDGRRIDLATSPGESRHFAGEVEANWFLPRVSDGGHRLVVRIRPMQGNFVRTYGGLWGDRVYDGVLVVPLARWTLDEVRRYIVNGTVPDHALP